MEAFDVKTLKYNKDGLIPAIIQDYRTKKVLMLAYMNEESVAKTIDTGKTWFYSRSRQQLWNKGETSGHYQYVKAISYDCDADTLLVQVEQVGVACHTGANSCFFNDIPVDKKDSTQQQAAQTTDEEVSIDANVLQELFTVIQSRKLERPEGSYTTYLFNKGLDKILKKVGEETAEVIIAAKGNDKGEVVYESADLLYHLMVMLVEQGLSFQDILNELAKRR